jgi:chemotaxis protein MotB
MSVSEQQPQPKRGASVVPWLIVVVLVTLLGLVGYYGYHLWKSEEQQLAEARAATEAERARANESERQRAELEAKLAALQQERSVLADERARLSTEKEQLAQVVQEKEAELAKLKATYQDIEDKLKSEIQDGAIRLSQAEGRIQVDLVDKILFDSGDASISPRGAEVLARLGGVLAKVEDKTIQVSGHTDDSPPSARLAATFPSNWELSTARAVNVVRFLQEKANVPARRLMATGHGDTQPVASNATPKGRARNRRIEVLLTPVLPSVKKAATAQAGTP